MQSLADLLSSYDLSNLQWVLLGISGLLIGMSKTGISGVGLMVVPLLANAFGRDKPAKVLPESFQQRPYY